MLIAKYFQGGRAQGPPAADGDRGPGDALETHSRAGSAAAGSQDKGLWEGYEMETGEEDDGTSRRELRTEGCGTFTCISRAAHGEVGNKSKTL